jgi:nitrite reductase/ring-hydroxylating ferredoxin subunit
VSLVGGVIVGNEIMCSAHGYHFDLDTGACSHDRSLRWRVFRITLLDGDLYVDLV